LRRSTVSHWWPEKLQIVLHPRQVFMLRLARGRSQRIIDKCVLSCPAPDPGKPLWSNPLTTLSENLPAFLTGRAVATVVLSNHFVRYGIFHSSDKVIRHDEEMLLVQHQFSRTYGGPATHWHYCLSPIERLDKPRIASAVDGELLLAMRTQFQQHRLKLHSIQPYLMTIYNQYRYRIRHTAWLALVEDGIICLARRQLGNWQSIKNHRIDTNWRSELAILMHRENFLAAQHSTQTVEPEPVLVFSPEYPEPIDIAQERSPEQAHDTHPVIILDPSQWPEPAKPAEFTQAIGLSA
jgi:hypothetical protein